MKRAFEALLVAVALVMAGYVTLHLARRSAPGVAPTRAPDHPGIDVEDPSDLTPRGPSPRAVKEAPMIKFTRPPRRRPRTAGPPPVPARS